MLTVNASTTIDTSILYDDLDKIKKLELEKISKDVVRLDEIQIKTIEEQPNNPNNKKLKDNIKEETTTNKKELEENKPKIIIKIPKPFAMGYFIIDLSALLGSILGLLSGFALGLLMSKIGDLMKSKLSFDMNSKKKLNASTINNALNSINISDIINETLDEENILKINKTLNDADITSDFELSKMEDDQFFDTMSNVDDTGNYINNEVPLSSSGGTSSGTGGTGSGGTSGGTGSGGTSSGTGGTGSGGTSSGTGGTGSEIPNVDNSKPYNTPKKNKPNKKKDIYTINRRGREDILNSPEANERLNYKSTNKKTIHNKNYGTYW